MHQPVRNPIVLGGGTEYSGAGVRPYISWVSDRQLICAVMRDADTPNFWNEPQAGAHAAKVLSESVGNVGSHVSVLESAGPTNVSGQPLVDLVLVDLDGGTRGASFSGKFRKWRRSRGRQPSSCGISKTVLSCAALRWAALE